MKSYTNVATVSGLYNGKVVTAQSNPVVIYQTIPVACVTMCGFLPIRNMCRFLDYTLVVIDVQYQKNNCCCTAYITYKLVLNYVNRCCQTRAKTVTGVVAFSHLPHDVMNEDVMPFINRESITLCCRGVHVKFEICMNY